VLPHFYHHNLDRVPARLLINNPAGDEVGPRSSKAVLNSRPSDKTMAHEYLTPANPPGRQKYNLKLVTALAYTF